MNGSPKAATRPKRRGHHGRAHAQRPAHGPTRDPHPPEERDRHRAEEQHVAHEAGGEKFPHLLGVGVDEVAHHAAVVDHAVAAHEVDRRRRGGDEQRQQRLDGPAVEDQRKHEDVDEHQNGCARQDQCPGIGKAEVPTAEEQAEEAAIAGEHEEQRGGDDDHLDGHGGPPETEASLSAGRRLGFGHDLRAILGAPARGCGHGNQAAADEPPGPRSMRPGACR